MGSGKRTGFYRRGRFWWTRDPVTGLRRSTGFTDLEAAQNWRAARERIASNPTYAAAEAATIGRWIGRFVAHKQQTKSEATAQVARQKLGHWIRIYGDDMPLARCTPALFDGFVTQRRTEDVSDHTISKEVVHMVAVLKMAKRVGEYGGDVTVLRPPDLHAGYRPRKRALSREELIRLLAQLEPRRGALVAICVALGCRLSEAFRLLPTDIGPDRVFVRGTKTEESERYVPILSLFRPLLELAAPYLPLASWGKIWRDLERACRRAGIDPCTPNDLRRTHATLLSESGVDRDVTRRLLGHTTPALVDRVYGQPTIEALASLAEERLSHAEPLGLVRYSDVTLDPDPPDGSGGNAGKANLAQRQSSGFVRRSADSLDQGKPSGTATEQPAHRGCARSDVGSAGPDQRVAGTLVSQSAGDDSDTDELDAWSATLSHHRARAEAAGVLGQDSLSISPAPGTTRVTSASRPAGGDEQARACRTRDPQLSRPAGVIPSRLPAVVRVCLARRSA